MFTFGFSYVGLVYLLMLFVPNIIWAKDKPQGYDDYVKNENRVLLAFEKAGEVLVTCCAVIFSDFNIRATWWAAWLALSFAFMVLYEIYWVRYFKSEKKMTDFYASIAGFPVAGASLPVIAFFLLGIYGTNIFMIVSSVILGIGHIGIHLQHRNEVFAKNETVRPVKRIFKYIGLGLISVIFLVISFVIGCRNYNYVRHYVNIASGGVDEEKYVDLCGQEQYLLIRGKSQTTPVMIYLHGGPASPDAYFTRDFVDRLTDKYTVICWDQRGCGRTYFHNIKSDPNNSTATFEQALDDLDALVDYARERFGQEKVMITGHSYGTMLGATYVLNHPEKVSEYTGIGQVVSLEKSDVYSYEDALQKAKASGDDTANLVSAYEKVKETGKLSDLMALRSLVSQYHPSGKPDNSTWVAITSPYCSIDDIRWYLIPVFSLDNYFGMNPQLYDYALTADMSNLPLEYKVPVRFISGSCDLICPVDSVRNYSEIITAPSVEFIIIDGCGHGPQFEDPETLSKYF